MYACTRPPPAIMVFMNIKISLSPYKPLSINSAHKHASLATEWTSFCPFYQLLLVGSFILDHFLVTWHGRYVKTLKIRLRWKNQREAILALVKVATYKLAMPLVPQPQNIFKTPLLQTTRQAVKVYQWADGQMTCAGKKNQGHKSGCLRYNGTLT